MTMSNLEEVMLARQEVQIRNESRWLTQSRILQDINVEDLRLANQMVDLWEARQLCSNVYIEGWRKILNANNKVNALRETAGWLNAFLQNSPLPVIAASQVRDLGNH